LFADPIDIAMQGHCRLLMKEGGQDIVGARRRKP
jgi:hypothetical protein